METVYEISIGVVSSLIGAIIAFYFQKYFWQKKQDRQKIVYRSEKQRRGKFSKSQASYSSRNVPEKLSPNFRNLGIIATVLVVFIMMTVIGVDVENIQGYWNDSSVLEKVLQVVWFLLMPFLGVAVGLGSLFEGISQLVNYRRLNGWPSISIILGLIIGIVLFYFGMKGLLTYEVAYKVPLFM